MTAPTPPAVESRGLTKQFGNKHYCPAAVLALCILSLLASASTLAAGTRSIRNDTLIASYNDVSNTFILTERSTARVFLKDGTLQGAAGKAQVESGQRSRLQVRQAHRRATRRRRLRVAGALPRLAIPARAGGTAQ